MIRAILKLFRKKHHRISYDAVAERHRRIARNGFKSRMGVL